MNVRFLNSTILRSSRVLSPTERKKIFLVVVIQIILGLFDLLGVAIFGILGSLAVSGVGERATGNRVTMALKVLHLSDNSLQFQSAVLGCSAAFILIFKTIFSVYFVRKTTFFLSRRSAGISSNLLSKVLSQPLTQLQTRSMQETLFSITAGVDTITMGVLNTTVLMVSDVALMLIIGIGLFIVDPIVALSSFLVFTAIGFALYLTMQARAKNLGAQLAQISIDSSEKILEVLNSYREIVVRNRRRYYATEIGKKRFELANVTAERSFMPNISKYTIEVTVVVGSLAIGALQFAVNDAAHAVAVLSVFLAASTRISPAVLRLQQSAIGIRSSLGVAGPTLDLIEELSGLSDRATINDLVQSDHVGFVPSIVVRNLSLKYGNTTKNALENISFEIEPGTVTSVVGPSGAGKTSLVDVILGIISPNEGFVKIGGKFPEDSITSWPGAIGYVPQDVMIINGTIRENIQLGFPNTDSHDDLVWDALKIANLFEFVQNLPEKLDTKVGDRGARLSGGQRQRLGIARAMFTKPKLLVLDEATSSLDGETESNISQAFQQLRGGVSVLMIAHRLSTVRDSDSVIYMSAGKIVCIGRFDVVRQQVPDFDKQAALMGL